MKGKIALITILTDEVPKLVRFYQDVLGFSIKTDMDQYIELENETVRFAICARSIMRDATGNTSFSEPRAGQTFELAFPLDNAEDVDLAYQEITNKGAVPVKPPANMPWGQRTAFFSDPDGNIHEIFSDLPEAFDE